MSFWSAVVVIVAIIAITEMIKSKHRSSAGTGHRHSGSELPAERNDPEARREIEDLRERIKVLERIATDNNTIDARETQRISEEIDRLRDRQG